MAARKGTVLPPSFSALQQKRRDEALESQRAARQRQLALARNGTDTSAQGSASAAGANVAQTVQPLLSASQHAAQDAPLSGAEAPTGPGEGSADAQMAAEPTSPSQSTGQSEHRKQRRSGARQKHRQRAAGGTQSGNAMDTEQAEDQQEGPADEHPRHYWSRQLQQPEWLTDVPADLSSAWLVMPRPEGTRVSIVPTRGKTTLRTRGGSVLCVGWSALPDGGPPGSGQARDASLLEGIWHAETRTLYLVDVLVWRGYALSDCTAEFRLYWLQSKLAEDPDMFKRLLNPPTHTDTAHSPAAGSAQPHTTHMDAEGVSHSNGQGVGESVMQDEEMSEGGGSGRQACEWMRVVPLPTLAADVSGLQAAYQGKSLIAHTPGLCDTSHSAPFVQDGIYLLHREGHYSAGQQTPLALLYKDQGCSRWPLDTGPKGETLEHQVVTLEYRMDLTVATCDTPPVVLGTMPRAWVQAMGPKLLRPGRLLRFTLREGGLQWAADGRPAGADLRYEGPANQRKGRADAFSKILFQHLARTQPVAWESLLAAARPAHLTAAADITQ